MMKEQTKCPICGKDGIPDFYQEDVVCPCCGSDLSVYRKINNLVTNDANTTYAGKKQKGLIGVLSFTTLALAIGCVSLYFQKQSVKESFPVENGVLHAEQRISELTDSVKKLKSEIESLKNQKLIPKHEYVVKKGDSFCRISRKELGTKKRYAEIISLNHLQANSILHIGDTLKMPER